MTNIINPAQPQLGASASAAAASPKTPSTPASPPPAGGAADQVSVSANALTASGLLQSARESDGIDAAAVLQMKTALQNGSYEISADDLAQAMLGAMKESMP